MIKYVFLTEGLSHLLPKGLITLASTPTLYLLKLPMLEYHCQQTLR